MPRVVLLVLAGVFAACGNGGPSITAADLPGADVATDPGARPDAATEGVTDLAGIDPGTKDPGGTDAGKDPGNDATGCTSSSTCNLGTICVGGACVPGCGSLRDCPDGLHCDPGSGDHGTCMECLSDPDCGGLRCILGGCVLPCSVDGDCASTPATPHCRSGTCAACTQDAHCALGRLCVDGSCVPGCRSERDCDTGKVCAPEAGPNGACVACRTSNDCGGKVCIAWACLADCSKVTCPTDRPTCDPATGACVAAPCSDECQAGQRSCAGTGIRDCGSFDTDPCLEWGGAHSCPAHLECASQAGGAAACGCSNPCGIGEQRCLPGSDTARDVCRQDASNCRYWSRESCADGQKCLGGGTCSCKEDCAKGSYRCDATYTTTIYRCLEDAAGCRYWWPNFVCTDGSVCKNGNCGG